MTVVAGAAEFNDTVEIGDPAPVWNDLPGVDGMSHSLADLESAKVIVLVFTCNSCPYAVDAEDRLIALDQLGRKKGFVVVAINVNKVPDDLLPAMKERAGKKKFEFPYLFDESQQIAKDYGARNTPQLFVIDADRTIAYMGSLDDSPDGRNVTKKYAEDAVLALLQGKKPVVTETVPVGCRIRFDRARRTSRPVPTSDAN
ncbi:MAG: thioredoxin family protein [Pirellulaceae bacterium]|nr:thioredoxin family protein [Pirellulaceae bacterium]